MPEVRNQPAETHESKQKRKFIDTLCILISIGITLYICIAHVLFDPYVIRMITGSDGKYYPKAEFLVDLIIVIAVVYPLGLIVKKSVGKKYQDALVTQSLGSHGQTEFSFSREGTVNTIILDEMYMQVKKGFTKKTFLISRLQNYYLANSRRYSTLYVTYEDDNGKIKTCMMPGEAGDRQVQLLNAELQKRFSAKSLNNLSRKEAFKILKMGWNLWYIITAVVVLLLVAGIVTLFIMFYS